MCTLTTQPSTILTPRQARWSQFLEEYILTLYYVSGLENPAADTCSRLTLRQLMDIKNATCTRALVIPLVETWVTPEGEPVEEFLHELEDSFSHDEVWSQPYDDLYVLLRSGRSVGKRPDVDEDADPAQGLDTEPAVEPTDLEPLPSNETLAEDSHQPEVHLDGAGNKVQHMSTDTDDPPDIDMDRPF